MQPVLLLVLVVLAVGAGLPAHGQPAPPEGYRQDHYRAPTPLTVPGAVTVDTAQVQALIAAGAVLIDVMPLRLGTVGPSAGQWLPAEPHHHIPGSVWLPNVGYGTLTPEVEAWFRAHLDRLSGGDRARPLVIYCKADCWMSWNASRRAAGYGYTGIHWYRDGTDGWREAGLDLVEAVPPPPPPRPRSKV